MTVNKAILIGNLGQDPELRTTGGGMSVCDLRLATTSRRKDRDGNWTDATEWHSVTVFGKTAENVARYCQKGKQLYIEGELRTDSWDDRETGKKRYKTYVVGNDVRFLGSKSDGDSQQPTGAGGTYDEDEIPF